MSMSTRRARAIRAPLSPPGSSSITGRRTRSIVDNAGGHLMQHGLIDMVIVGSDRTTANGDVCNKIGTYLKALAARDNAVPFYVALPSPTIDWTVRDGQGNPDRGAQRRRSQLRPGPGRRRRDHARQDRAGRGTRRQSGVRRHARSPCDRAHHRARRRGGLARGAEGAVSRSGLERAQLVFGRAASCTPLAPGRLHDPSACRPEAWSSSRGSVPGRSPAACSPISAPSVVAVVRPDKAALGDPDRPLSDDPLRRGKRIVALDLKRARSRRARRWR